MLDSILCIDDDPITLMINKKVISKADFSKEIITAQNGEQALDYLKNISQINSDNKETILPQLIFIDLNMPVMGGWDFLDRFSSEEFADYKTTKVVVLSSTIDPEDLAKSKTYPMVLDFLPKPISLSMLENLKDKMDQD